MLKEFYRAAIERLRPVAESRSLTAVGEAGFGHCSAETGGEAARQQCAALICVHYR